MLISIIYAFIITVFIGFMVENFKLTFYLRRVDFINLEIRNSISSRLLGKKTFDIFTVNVLRKTLNEEFLHTKMVDKYELYKINDSKIKLKYIKGYIIEELEILAVEGGVELIEIDKKVLE